MKLNTKKIIDNLILGLVFVLPFNFAYISNFDDIQSFLFFNETFKYSLFIFDLLFIPLLIFWLKKKISLKKVSSCWVVLLLLFYLVLLSFISIDPPNALYNSLRLTEVILFFCIFVDTAKRKKIFQKVVYLVFLSGIIQSIIAFTQFILQKSIGLKYLGESLLNPNILGVAKIEVAGEKFIRAYGTFPHSNLLGAFLFLSLVAGLYFVFSKDPEIPFSLPENLKRLRLKKANEILASKTHFRSGLMIIVIGIIVTFSRSIWLITAYLSLLMGLRYLKYLFQGKYLLKYILPIILFLIIVLVGFNQFIPARVCLGNCQDQSLTLRQNYLAFSKTVIADNFILGVGPGQFISVFKKQNPTNLLEWNIQPVHNLYLLAFSEIGFIGFLLILVFLIKNFSFRNISKDNELFLIAFGGFIILGIFDHYFWTLPQGQFIFWLSLALLASSGRIEK